MKVMFFALVFLCLGCMQFVGARAQPVESSPADADQVLVRRYAESTIASDISKIMDSMVQKNFVNFLLNQREKKSTPAMTQEDAYAHDLSDLLKKEFIMWIHSKGDKQ